jgi:tetratricopeptide (TPR) repeat protein
MRRICAAVIVIAAVAGATVVVEGAAWADEKSDQARKAFEDGKKAYNLGEFDKAVELWKAGYDIKDDPVFLFNIAQAYRQKQDYAKAIFFYKAFLREDPKAKNRADVESRIAEMQKLLDDQKSTTGGPPTGVGTIGTGDTGTGDTGTGDTGTGDTGTGDTGTGDTGTGDTGTGTGDDDGNDRPPGPVESGSAGKGLKIGGLVTAGIGVALVVTGIVFAMKASSLQGEVQDAVDAGMPWSEDLSSKDSDGKSAATMGKVLTIIGAAAVVGGGVMYFMGRSKANAARSAYIVPTVTPNEAGVMVRLSF